MWALLALTLWVNQGSVSAQWIVAYKSASDCDAARDNLTAGEGPRDYDVTYVCVFAKNDK